MRIEFLAALRRADTLIAHNLAFDEKVLGAELLRCGLPNPLPSLPPPLHHRRPPPSCAGCPGTYGYKWPRLDELHRHLFCRGMVAAHNALVDVEACARCFFQLQRLGVIA